MYHQLYSIHENKDAIALKVIDYEFFTKYHATDCHDKLSSLTQKTFQINIKKSSLPIIFYAFAFSLTKLLFTQYHKTSFSTLYYQT